MPGPVLFCYDGSDGSRGAMVSARELVVHPAPVVVLTIWQPASALLAQAGGWGYLSNETQVDGDQAQLARAAADEGVERARGHGFEAEGRVEEATEGAGRKIVEIANELDARLIVCGRRGRGAVASALLGSVSHEVLAHARRPVLIAPEAG
jgi:nucleotide-binding universal stress UspA family protein